MLLFHDATFFTTRNSFHVAQKFPLHLQLGLDVICFDSVLGAKIEPLFGKDKSCSKHKNPDSFDVRQNMFDYIQIFN